MARSYVRQNVVNRFELQPRSGERSYDSLFRQTDNKKVPANPQPGDCRLDAKSCG